MPAIVNEQPVRGAGKRPRLYGWLCDLDNGEKMYIARRKHREIFRSGKASISGAMQEEVASWAIDEDLLFRMRARGVKYIAVRVIDTGDFYLTRLSVFFDRKTSKLRDYTGVGRGGSRQRYVPLQHFALKRSVVRLDDTELN